MIITLNHIGLRSDDMRTGEKFRNRNFSVTIFRTALLIVAAVMIIVGIINGGMKEVFVKAVNICTECIGLE